MRINSGARRPPGMGACGRARRAGRPRPCHLPLRLLALAACLGQAPGAQAIVIQVNQLDSSGRIVARDVSDGWRLVHPYPTNPAYFRYEKDGMTLDTPTGNRFSVLSLTEPWALGSRLDVDSTSLQTLTVNAGGLLASGRVSVAGHALLNGSVQAGFWGASFGSLRLAGGSLVSDSHIGVAGHAEILGDVRTGSAAFGSLSMSGGSFNGNADIGGALSLRNSVVSGETFMAQSAQVDASTLLGLALTVRGGLQLQGSTLGRDTAQAAGLQADSLTLTGSTVHVRSLTVGRTLALAGSTLVASDGQFDGVTDWVLEGSTLQSGSASRIQAPQRLDLRAASLLLPSAQLTLSAGSSGTFTLGLDAASTLQTGSTLLQASAPGTLQEAVFTQAAGHHRTGGLWIAEGTAYVLAAPAAGADGPVLTANVTLEGALRMRGGTLTGSLVVGEHGSFAQSAGESVLTGGWGVAGHARLDGTARLEASSISLDGRGLEIAEQARVTTGDLSIHRGNLLLDRPDDSPEAPALRSRQVLVHGGFQHTRGSHLAERVQLGSGDSDAQSGWYWLDGGLLKADTLWIAGHFEQRGGTAQFKTTAVTAAFTPDNANLLLAGGLFKSTQLSAWTDGSRPSPRIRHTGGAAEIDALSLFGARYELAIDQPSASTNDLTLTSNLWISGTAERPGSLAHSAGRLLSRGQQVVDAHGSYLLTGSGVFDGRPSDEPFEVLSGARVTQDGANTLLHARGLSVDAGAQGLLRDGQTELREWLAVSGSLRMAGQARVTVGGSEFGLQVGVPFLPDEHEAPTPGQGTGWLTLALADKGLLHTSQAGVGTFESGVLQHDSGRHEVDSTLTLGSTRVLSDAVYLLGSTLADLAGTRAELDAPQIVLVNDQARTDAERSRVRLEQVLGRGSLGVQHFSNRQGLHFIHAAPAGDAPQDGAATWRLGDYLAPDGSRLHASYASQGGALFVQGGLHLADNSRMTIAPSPHLRGWAELWGGLQLSGRATLALTDQMLLGDVTQRPTLMVRGGLTLDSSAADPQAWALAVHSATVQVLGAGVAADTATVRIGPSRSTQSLRLDGAGTLMQISGAQRTQLHIGTQGAGSVSVSDHAALELRAAPLGTVRPTISGNWQPLVIGRADMQGQPELTIDRSSRLLVEGLGHQITVASGTASLGGTFQAVVLGKPGSPAVVGRPASSNGLLKLADSSRIELSFDGYVPQVGDYIPLASAHSIQWGSNASSLSLTPYQAVTVAGVAGYEFSLGAGNAVFRVAAPSAGLYPALERMKLNGTEVLGIRFVDQAVVLNFVDRIGGSYAASGTGWAYQPSDRVAMAGTSLNQAALVQAFGSALWGTAPEQWLGTGSLGTQLLLPYFVADDAFDASRRLANAVEVRFSDTRVGSLAGHAPAQSNSSGWFPIDLGNARKDGLVHVLDAAATQASDPAALTSTVLHEIGHALGLLHSYQAGTANRMDDVDTAHEAFANQPLAWTEAPTAQGWNLLLSQNAQLHLLKYSFGWSDAELAAFGAQYGTLDGGWSAALNSLLLSVKASLSGLGEALSFAQLTVQTPSLTADGATLWEPLLSLDAAALADLQHLQFSGIRGLSFRIVGSLAGQPDAEIRFVGDATGGSGRFAEGELAGRLVQVNLLTGEQQDLGAYTLTQTAAVPEPAAPALFAAGGLLLWALRRRRAALSRAPRPGPAPPTSST